MDAVAGAMPYVSSLSWRRHPNAYVEIALCCPSRAAILSGRFDFRNGVLNNATADRFDDTATVATALHGAGYRTGLVGKYFNHYPFGRPLYVPPGWDDWFTLLRDTFYRQYDFDADDNGVVRHYGSTPADYQGAVLQAEAVRFIQSTPTNRPFFLFYTPVMTHLPFVAAPPDVGRHPVSLMPHFPNQQEADVSDKPAYIQALPQGSQGSIDQTRAMQWDASTTLDGEVRAIDRAVAASGRAANTVYIYMSDNGYAWGAHRWSGKRCEYEECAHVPLMMRGPGITPGTDRRLALNVDVGTTVLRLAGGADPAAQDGRSLFGTARTAVLQHWPGGDDAGNQTAGRIPEFWALRTRQYRYVELATGETELYDLAKDPFELVNVSASPAYAQVRGALAAQLQGSHPAGPTPPAQSPGIVAGDSD